MTSNDHFAQAQRAAALAHMHLTLAARAAMPGSTVQQDAAGAAEDLLLVLEAYAHLWPAA